MKEITRIKAYLLAAGMLCCCCLAGCAAQGNEVPGATGDAGTATPSATEQQHESDPATQAAQPADGLAVEDVPATALISAQDLHDRLEAGEDLQVIDVRSVRSYASGHVEGARNIPLNQVGVRSDEVRRDCAVVLIATKNEDVAEMRAALIEEGIAEENILVVDGGVVAWEKAGYEFTAPAAMGC